MPPSSVRGEPASGDHPTGLVERNHGQRLLQAPRVDRGRRQENAVTERCLLDPGQPLSEGHGHHDRAPENAGDFHNEANWEVATRRCYPFGSHGQSKTTETARSAQQGEPRSQAQRGPRLILDGLLHRAPSTTRRGPPRQGPRRSLCLIRGHSTRLSTTNATTNALQLATAPESGTAPPLRRQSPWPR